MVELLIFKHDTEVDARDKEQQTPLHKAVGNGHSDVVTTLIQNRAEVTVVDTFGRNALELAIEKEDE